ncbi:ABC transporter permease [Lutibaculum baratangense]|uniref:Amino acid ABC transporter, permease protein n=1 Tax=Lutibaculum baratangense AMV1 TaxID=631454 RepID=V4RKZ3_9HYPH|nr:ABC transporter permease [Lutibaculum baratangense]ESR26736.1 Amino acid ABC transporter, permease protein [Lutibaculum baratangense AMV1]
MSAKSDLRPPPRARRWDAPRVAGHVLMGVWIAAGVLLAIYLVGAFSTDFAQRYGFRMLSGFWTTIELVTLSLLIGAAISLPVAAGRLSPNPVIGALAYGYVYFFRGTPLLAQTFLVYYGAGSFRAELDAVGLWTFFRDAWFCAVFTFSLNTSAYQAEILAGAIRTVPRSQIEAGQALGLSRYVIATRIVLPQALVVALRPYGNEVVLMIKGSAIASIITIYDLMGETRRAFSRSFDFQTYIWAAILYLVLVETLRRLWDVMERRLTRHLVRDDT